MLRRALTAILYVMLVLVVVSTARSVWLGLNEPGRYLASFPGAEGPLFHVTLATSAAAALVSLLIALRRRWAVWPNIAIGLWSIALLDIVQGSRINQLIVLAACATTSALPLILWRRPPQGRTAHGHA